MRKIRLFVDSPFVVDTAIEMSTSQGHYLINVMRCRGGERVVIFNGQDGEWEAALEYQKKRLFVIPKECKQPQSALKVKIGLIQGLIKRQEIVIEKATELGVAEIFPLRMDYSVCTALNTKKAVSWAIEAAEQSERLTIPSIHAVGSLKDLLAHWPLTKTILWAAERVQSVSLRTAVSSIQNDFAILIGPEGGISPIEQQHLRSHPAVIPVSLGKRIFRSETAVIVSLALAIDALSEAIND